MDLYLDTGNIEEIKDVAEIGILDGVTTNPTLIMREGMKFEKELKKIASVMKKNCKKFTLSAEVTSDDWQSMVKEGVKLAKLDSHIIIKVPLTEQGIKAVKEFTKKRIKTNVTLCFSANQALIAAKAGAYIISPFVGRLDDIGQDGIELIREIRDIYDNYGLKTKILAASIRSPASVKASALAGADIATVPYNIFKKLFNHPLTDKGIEIFKRDWETFNDGL